MFWEEPRVPGLPGAEDVTDGSVDYYDTDWENVENGALEEEMQKCNATPCTAQTTCFPEIPSLSFLVTPLPCTSTFWADCDALFVVRASSKFR